MKQNTIDTRSIRTRALTLPLLGALALLALVVLGGGVGGAAAAPPPPPTPALSPAAADPFPPAPPAASDARAPGGPSVGLSAPAPLHAAAPYALPDPVWRIGITADGLYRLSYETLAAAGVPVTGPPSAFHLLWRGQEVALQESGTGDGTFDPGDALLFYAERFHGSVQDEKYTRENVYWLAVDGSTPGLRMTSRSVIPSGSATPLTWYTATVHAEQEVWYWARWRTDPGTDATWFWDDTTTITPTVPVSRGYELTCTAPLSEVYSATLTAELAARSQITRTVRFTLNGTPVGETAWEDDVGITVTLPFPAALIQDGNNTVTVTLVPHGSSIARVYLNWIELQYRRRPAATADTLSLTTPFSGSTVMTLTGFSTSTVALYDVTYPLTPTRLVSATAALSGTTWTQTLSDTVPAGTSILAVAGEAELEAPAPTIYHPPSNLISPTTGADEIIVAPAEFMSAIQPLAQRRRAEGLRVRVVDVEDVYALFNGGVFHPEAIRSLVTHATANWPGPPPAYLLLVGDGHFNMQGNNPAVYGTPPPVWIPPYLAFADPYQGEVPLDSAFGDVDGDGLSEVAVGRIPAGSVAEVQEAVSRILAYEDQPLATWRWRVLLVADDYDEDVGNYRRALEDLRQNLLPTRIEVQTVYLDEYASPEPARLALTQTWGTGAMMVTYAGHGAVYRWAAEPLLTTWDVATIPSGHGMPFVLSLDCLDGYWMSPPNFAGLPETRSLAETLLLTPGRGAVAVFAPAGLGTLAQEEIMARAMYLALFEDGTTRLGPLTQAGRDILWWSHLSRIYTLFGDPAMRLVAPPHGIFLPLALRGF